MFALGNDAKIAKVFKKNTDNKILVHSLALVTPLQENSVTYAINAGGTKDHFWVQPTTLNSRIVNEWIVWKVARDQWEMGLADSSQEATTIIADAKNYYSKLRRDI